MATSSQAAPMAVILWDSRITRLIGLRKVYLFLHTHPALRSGCLISHVCYWRRSQFPSKLHHQHGTQFLCVSKPLSRYWHHEGQTLRNCPWQCSARGGAHHISNLTYITDPCFLVQASVPWLSRCRQLEQAYTAGRKRLPHFFFSLFLPSWGYFKIPHSLMKIQSKIT